MYCSQMTKQLFDCFIFLFYTVTKVGGSMKNRKLFFISIIAFAIFLLPAKSYAQQKEAEYFAVLNFDVLKTVNPDNHYRDYGTVSYIKDGTEMLANGVREEVAISPDDSRLHNLYAKDYFAPFSTNYNSLTYDDVILKTNAFWNPVKAKARYINYIEQSNAKPRQEWIDYFHNVITEECGRTDSPIIISEAWITWWNGVEYAAVNASNYVWRSSLQPTEYYNNPDIVPAGDNHLMYRSTMIFANGEPMNEYKSDICYWKINTTPLNREMEHVCCSFIPAEDESILYCEDFVSYQYDECEKLKLYAVYDLCYWINQEMRYSPDYFFGDIDGDGNLETVVYRRSHNSMIMGGYTVFDLDRETINHSFGVNDGM